MPVKDPNLAVIKMVNPEISLGRPGDGRSSGMSRRTGTQQSMSSVAIKSEAPRNADMYTNIVKNLL